MKADRVLNVHKRCFTGGHKTDTPEPHRAPSLFVVYDNNNNVTTLWLLGFYRILHSFFYYPQDICIYSTRFGHQ